MLNKLGKISKFGRAQQGQSIPPGQYVTEKFPILTFGPTPKIELDAWQFKVFGLVKKELVLDWKQFAKLDKTTVVAPFHCVTQWSRLENTWEGVTFNALMKLVKHKPEARYVMIHCYGNYTTNLALNVLQKNDVLFAYRHDGDLLSPEHGGPLRLVVPKRYGWKSAKWVNGLEFVAENTAGFWEARGYSMDGDPFKEQRFRNSLK